MPSVLDSLRSLAASVAGALPCVDALAGLSAADEAEAVRVLGGIRAATSETIALLASDIERKSARELGTAGLAQRNGFKDAAGFVQDLAGVDRGEAARLIRVGGLLETAHAVEPVIGAGSVLAVPPPERSVEHLRGVAGSWDAPIAVALKNGWLTAAQSDALRRCLGAPRSEELQAGWREASLELIGDCWSGHWSPEDLARAAKRVRGALDGLAAQSEARARYRLRSLRRAVRRSGMVHYDIDLDPESDARFYGPIRRLLSPRFGGPRFTAEGDIVAARELEHDPRTNEQLQVDTLVELIDRAVAADDKALFKTGEPHIMIAVTTAELAKARDTQEALLRHHAGEHSGCPSVASGGAAAECPGPDVGIAWIDGNDSPITALDAQRMICGSGFTPALFDETGQAIDIGKDQRYFSRRQRRVIAKRDGGCLYPGCDRPPEDCEYHHRNPWAQHPSHRKSEVRDGVLLCRRHHKLVHDFGAYIDRRGGDYWLRWPGKEPQRLHSKSGVQAQLRLQGSAA